MMNEIATENQIDSTLSKTDPHDEQEGVDLVEVMIVVAKRKKAILGAAFAAALISSAVSLQLPSVYESEVRLLPPQQSQSSTSMLLSQLGGLAGVAGAAGIKNPADVYVSMFKSRTLADRMIDRFSLQKHYEISSREKARGRLQGSTAIVLGKEGLITIRVEDEDQNLVASLANGYVDELFRLTKTLAVTEAAQRRLFFEHELENAKNNLVKSEIALKGAMDEHGVVSVDTEGRAQLATIARLRAQATSQEITLSSMKAFVTPDNPEYRRAAESLSSVRAELARLENGRVDAGTDISAARTTSTTGIKNIQLLRDVKYHEMLYELLAKQYEAARLDEAKDPSVIQVLDQAVKPERRSKPKRAFIVLLSTFLAAAIAVIFVLLAEAKKRWLESPGAPKKWNNLKASIQSK
jgi:uncharacterized protein involved in exopolysaccharide biosynthesis